MTLETANRVPTRYKQHRTMKTRAAAAGQIRIEEGTVRVAEVVDERGTELVPYSSWTNFKTALAV